MNEVYIASSYISFLQTHLQSGCRNNQSERWFPRIIFESWPLEAILRDRKTSPTNLKLLPRTYLKTLHSSLPSDQQPFKQQRSWRAFLRICDLSSCNLPRRTFWFRPKDECNQANCRNSLPFQQKSPKFRKLRYAFLKRYPILLKTAQKVRPMRSFNFVSSSIFKSRLLKSRLIWKANLENCQNCCSQYAKS